MPTPADLRQTISDLATLAAADLRDLWASVDSPTVAAQALHDILPPLTTAYASAASTVAADWYDNTRDELNVDGRFSAITAELDDLGANALAGWSADALLADEPDWDLARSRTEGGLQLRIANASRQTVMVSSIEDPKARGWQRSASGGCAFCQMLAARGVVYSRGTVDFGAHDHCKCVAVAAFTGREIPVKPYEPTLRNVSDADRARTREYLAKHFPDVRG